MKRPTLVAVGLVIAVATAGCAGDDPRRITDERGESAVAEWVPPVEQPSAPLDVKEVFRFTSLAEMVATSPTVIEGQVIDVVAGRVFEQGSGTIRMSRAIVRVTEQLAGASVPDTISLEEDGFFGPFLVPGDTGVMFIYPMEDVDEVLYGWIGSQGRLLFEGDMVVSMNDGSAWVQELEAMSPEEARVEIAEALRDVEAGLVEPAAPTSADG